MRIKQFLKDVTGITAKEEKARILQLQAEEEKERRRNQQEESSRKRKEKKEKELEATLSKKELATRKGEAFVDVVQVHTDAQNLSHGFFELDWNDLFIVQLKQQGYGYDGDPDEEIVDRWFKELCGSIASEEQIDMSSRSAGYINVKKLFDNKSEVS